MDKGIKFQWVKKNVIKIKKRRIIKDDNISYNSSVYKSSSSCFGLGGYGIELI